MNCWKYDNAYLSCGAVPHGRLFLGFSINNKAIAAYHIKVCSPRSAGGTACSALSIAEVPIVTSKPEKVAEQFLFSSLGKGSFCSLSCLELTSEWEKPPVHVSFRLVTYQMKDPIAVDSLEPEEEELMAMDSAEIVTSGRWKQVLKPWRFVIHPGRYVYHTSPALSPYK